MALLAVGSGKRLRGLFAAGLAVGAGGDVEGIALGGLAVGCGGTLRGIALAGLGIGAPHIQAITLSLAAGAETFQGIALAPAYFRIPSEGQFSGFGISAFNHILGEQHGVVIGIFNYATSLHGLQIGLVNYAGNNPPGLQILPIANAHFD
jgi:hypothetical protein